MRTGGWNPPSASGSAPAAVAAAAAVEAAAAAAAVTAVAEASNSGKEAIEGERDNLNNNLNFKLKQTFFCMAFCTPEQQRMLTLVLA